MALNFRPQNSHGLRARASRFGDSAVSKGFSGAGRMASSSKLTTPGDGNAVAATAAGLMMDDGLWWFSSRLPRIMCNILPSSHRIQISHPKTHPTHPTHPPSRKDPVLKSADYTRARGGGEEKGFVYSRAVKEFQVRKARPRRGRISDSPAPPPQKFKQPIMNDNPSPSVVDEIFSPWIDQWLSSSGRERETIIDKRFDDNARWKKEMFAGRGGGG